MLVNAFTYMYCVVEQLYYLFGRAKLLIIVLIVKRLIFNLTSPQEREDYLVD